MTPPDPRSRRNRAGRRGRPATNTSGSSTTAYPQSVLPVPVVPDGRTILQDPSLDPAGPRSNGCTRSSSCGQDAGRFCPRPRPGDLVLGAAHRRPETLCAGGSLEKPRLVPDRPNQLWVADLTYLAIPAGVMYWPSFLDDWRPEGCRLRDQPIEDARIAVAAPKNRQQEP
jgi:hypothetical protein